jgi:hypothetical protein
MESETRLETSVQLRKAGTMLAVATTPTRVTTVMPKKITKESCYAFHEATLPVI